MKLTFTPKAAQKLLATISDRGGNLALHIKCSRSMSGMQWRMTLEPLGPQAQLVCGVPVTADKASQEYLDEMVVDWVQTPEGPGFGVFNRSLVNRDYSHAAD